MNPFAMMEVVAEFRVAVFFELERMFLDEFVHEEKTFAVFQYLNARSRLGANVDFKGSCIDFGEELLPQPHAKDQDHRGKCSECDTSGQNSCLHDHAQHANVNADPDVDKPFPFFKETSD